MNIKCKFSFFAHATLTSSYSEVKGDSQYTCKETGQRKGCEETQSLQTTGSGGQQQVTETQCCLEKEQARLGKHKQGLNPKAS